MSVAQFAASRVGKGIGNRLVFLNSGGASVRASGLPDTGRA